jgi:uncharacterized protein YbaP (TraB family)
MPLRPLHSWLAALLLGLLSLLCAPSATARTCPPETTPRAAVPLHEAAPDRGFLWRLHRNGGHTHLYGTLHVGRADWAALGPLTQQALAGSDGLALELDPTDAATQRELMQRLAQPLATPLPAALLDRLRRHAEAECLPWSALQALRPELQLTLITLSAARRQALEAEHGSELVLLARARQLNQPVHALETPAEQAQALLLQDEARLASWLHTSLTDLENEHAATVLRRVATASAQRDAQALATYEHGVAAWTAPWSSNGCNACSTSAMRAWPSASTACTTRNKPSTWRSAPCTCSDRTDCPP